MGTRAPLPEQSWPTCSLSQSQEEPNASGAPPSIPDAVSRQPRSASVNSRSLDGEITSGEVWSVSAVARRVSWWRRQGSSIGGGRRVAVDDVKGIGDAPQPTPGRGCRALLVARERAIAQARLVVPLDAERIARADGVGRLGGECGKPAGSQQQQQGVAHSMSPFDGRTMRAL